MPSVALRRAPPLRWGQRLGSFFIDTSRAVSPRAKAISRPLKACGHCVVTCMPGALRAPGEPRSFGSQRLRSERGDRPVRVQLSGRVTAPPGEALAALGLLHGRGCYERGAEAAELLLDPAGLHGPRRSVHVVSPPSPRRARSWRPMGP